jgi:translation initiation factor IF-1
VTEESRKQRGRGQNPEAQSQKAEVVELLPSAAYRLRLENEEVVIAHAAGAAEKNFMRLRPGDRVRVERSARDKSRGRIVELLRKG